MSDSTGSKLAGRTILTKGILITLLGVVHMVGVFTFEASKIDGQLAGELRRDYLIWFAGVGMFILFMGLVDLLIHRGVTAGRRPAWQVALLCSIFTTLLGLLGVITFGISPPLVLLVTGAAGVLALGASRGKMGE